MSLVMPPRPRSFGPLALSFACSVVLVVAWRISHVNAIGSASWVAVVVMLAIRIFYWRHYQAYKREIRALGQREKSDRG